MCGPESTMRWKIKLQCNSDWIQDMEKTNNDVLHTQQCTEVIEAGSTRPSSKKHKRNDEVLFLSYTRNLYKQTKKTIPTRCLMALS